MLYLFHDHFNTFCHMIPLLLTLSLHAHALSVTDLLHPFTCILTTCKPTYIASFICIVHYIMLIAIICSSLESKKYFRFLFCNYYMLIYIYKHSVKDVSCHIISTYQITLLLPITSITPTSLCIVILVLCASVIYFIHTHHAISKTKILFYSLPVHLFMINPLLTSLSLQLYHYK